MEEKFDNKAWFDYIKKLNDRELSNKSSSGITLWALLGFIGYLVFRVLDALPVIMANQKSTFTTILFICTFYNVFLIFIIVISTYSYNLLEKEGGKLQTKLNLRTTSILKISIILVSMLGIALNIYMCIYYKIGYLEVGSYYLFVISYLGLVIGTLLINSTKIKGQDNLKIDFDTSPNYKVLIIGDIVLSLVFVDQCRGIIIRLSIINNIEFIKIALQTM